MLILKCPCLNDCHPNEYYDLDIEIDTIDLWAGALADHEPCG